MRAIATIVLTTLAFPAVANPADEWLAPRTVEPTAAKVLREISASDFFEVPVSMLEGAEQRLQSTQFALLAPHEVDSLSRGHFSCRQKTSGYLVRAVYSAGPTGGYRLTQLDSALWVSHSSLGVSTGMHRSALIACLRFKPSEAFVTSGGAM